MTVADNAAVDAAAVAVDVGTTTRLQNLDAGVHLPQHDAGIPTFSSNTRPNSVDSSSTSMYVMDGCCATKRRILLVCHS